MPEAAELLADPIHGAAWADHFARKATHGGGPSRRPSPGRAWSDPVLPKNLFVTTARLAADTLALAAKLPPSIDHVAAIPRSGLIPGSMIAAHLHVPLSIAGREGVQEAGHGIRMDGPARTANHVLLIDDTAAYGREMARREPIVRAAFPGAAITKAVVYSTPEGRGAVDYAAAIIPPPHYLAWNWQNAGHGQGCTYDFDGILCRDCLPEEDDDGPRYLEFVRTASPLYLPRRTPIHTIVTARHAKYRAETLAWLDHHRVTVEHLVMRDWDYDPGRSWPEQVGAWKAEHYRRSGQPLMAESCPEQARIIAERTRKPVLCPAAESVILPPPSKIGRMDAEIIAQWRDCTHRQKATGCGCDTCVGGPMDGQRVLLDDCERCIRNDLDLITLEASR